MKLFRTKYRVHLTDGKTEVLYPSQFKYLFESMAKPHIKFVSWEVNGETFLIINLNNITKIDTIRTLNI